MLDARTSQNAGFPNSFQYPVSVNPTLIAVVGLQAVNPTGVIRVQAISRLPMPDFQDHRHQTDQDNV